jgi:uroporphyrinogen decarboxylase
MYLESDRLSQTERLRMVLDHQEPDRLPIYINGMPVYSEFYQEFLQREDELLESFTENEKNILLTPAGDFTIPAFFGSDIVFRGCHVEYPPDQWLDSSGKFTDRGIEKEGKQTGLKVTYFGRLEKIDLLPNGYPYMWYEGGYLRKEEDIINWFDRYGWPHEQKVIGFDYEKIKQSNAQFDRSILLLPSYGPGLYENTWFMMGQDKFAHFSRKNPDLIRKIINSIAQLQIQQIEKMGPLNPLAVLSCDDMGQKGRSLLSPAAHHKFFFDARKAIFDAIHNVGAKAIMHSCGNIVELIPDLLAAGMDGWQTLEAASDIDNAAVKAQYGDRMSFWGAIDNNVLCFGTPETVDAHVRTVIRQLGKGGGYIAGPGHDYLNTKVDLALAMKDAILRHGHYPLK